MSLLTQKRLFSVWTKVHTENFRFNPAWTDEYLFILLHAKHVFNSQWVCCVLKDYNVQRHHIEQHRLSAQTFQRDLRRGLLRRRVCWHLTTGAVLLWCGHAQPKRELQQLPFVCHGSWQKKTIYRLWNRERLHAGRREWGHKQRQNKNMRDLC